MFLILLASLALSVQSQSCSATLSCPANFFCYYGHCTSCSSASGISELCKGLQSLATCPASDCKHCSSNSDCPGGKESYCSTSNNCMECKFNSECSALTPKCQNGACVECVTPASCSMTPSPICDTNYRCTNCSTNADCAIGSFCSLGNCIQCQANSDCTSRSASLCSNFQCVQCTTLSDCAHIGPTVDCVLGNCEECTTNSDCIQDPRPFCFSLTCHECVTNAECPYQKRYCNNTAFPYTCARCTSNLDCNTPFPFCINGTCVSCSSDIDCASGLCIFGSCRQCLNNFECMPSAPFCLNGVCANCSTHSDCVIATGGKACVLGACYDCIANANCSNPNSPVCNSTFQCESCQNNSDCNFMSGKFCVGGSCINCIDDLNCTDPGRSQCYLGQCVPCLNDTGCRGATPFCVAGMCTACTSTSCPPGQNCLGGNCTTALSIPCSTTCTNNSFQNQCIGGVCSPCTTAFSCNYYRTPTFFFRDLCFGGNCVECTVNYTFYCDSHRSHCNGTRCVPCLTNSECPSNQQCEANHECNLVCNASSMCTNHMSASCNTTNSRCIPCQRTADCSRFSPWPYCIAGNCEQCVADFHCTFGAPYCIGGNCHNCKINKDCSTTGSSWCNTGFNCQRCITNAECTHLGLTPYCNASIGCVQCISNSNCPTIYPLCNSQGKCSQCVSHSDCTNPQFPFCSLATLTCIVCSSDADCSSNPSKPYCDNGRCVACLDDTMCPYMTPVCNASVCIACTMDIQCYRFTNYKFCSSGSCSICSTNSECAGYNSSAPVCLSGVCSSGCNSDADCTNSELPICSSSNSCRACESNDENADCGLDNIPQPAGFQAVGSSNVGVFAATSVSILSGNPSSFMKQVAIMQILLSLLFFNVDYPAIVVQFIRMFKVGSFSFIPNPFLWIDSDLKDMEGWTPLRYRALKVSGILVKDSGHILFLIVSLIVLDFLLMLIAKPFDAFRTILQKVRKAVGATFVFKFVSSISILLLISILAQLFYAHPSDLMLLSSFIVAASVFAIFVGLSVYIFWVHRVMKGMSKSRLAELLKKYEVFFEGFISGATSVPKPFLAVIFGKTIFQMVALVGLFYYPSLQIVGSIAIQATYLVIIIKKQPFVNKLEMYLNLFTEVFLFVAFLIVMSFTILERGSPAKNFMGYTLIGLAAMLIIFSQMMCIYEIYLAIKEYLVNRKKETAKNSLKKFVKLDSQTEWRMVSSLGETKSTSKKRLKFAPARKEIPEN